MGVKIKGIILNIFINQIKKKYLVIIKIIFSFEILRLAIKLTRTYLKILSFSHLIRILFLKKFLGKKKSSHKSENQLNLVFTEVAGSNIENRFIIIKF